MGSKVKYVIAVQSLVGIEALPPERGCLGKLVQRFNYVSSDGYASCGTEDALLFDTFEQACDALGEVLKSRGLRGVNVQVQKAV